jgi:hypothetical protein
MKAHDTRKPIRIDLPFDEAIERALQVPEWPKERRNIPKPKKAKRPGKRPARHSASHR